MFRLAKKQDLEQIMKIISDAKDTLKKSGSLQWNGKDDYPNQSDFLEDINHEQLYVLEKNSILVGVCALIKGKDKNYELIKGKWISNKEYLSIHRIAVLKSSYGQGVSHELIKQCKFLAKINGISSIKGDTHRLNIPMQKLFLKEGFRYCGTINLIETLEDNERLAFEYFE